ncbi:MAG: hypothetical protein ABJD07_14780 [Gemmatimonadaceae bacterium]
MSIIDRRAAIAKLALSALALAAAACTHNPPPGDGALDENFARKKSYLVVDNQSFNDRDVYVVRSGQRYRLGRAQAHVKTRYEIPLHLINGLTPLRVMADPSGSAQQTVSNEVTVQEGDEVLLVIPPGS